MGSQPTSARNPATLEVLTEREQQIVKLVAQSYANKEIAQELNLSEATVKVHMKSLCKRIGARNRVAVAVWYLEVARAPSFHEAQVHVTSAIVSVESLGLKIQLSTEHEAIDLAGTTLALCVKADDTVDGVVKRY
jgi:DNA-binding CsgD family transcriptional regulator